jgi:hypothetical protein
MIEEENGGGVEWCSWPGESLSNHVSMRAFIHAKSTHTASKAACNVVEIGRLERWCRRVSGVYYAVSTSKLNRMRLLLTRNRNGVRDQNESETDDGLEGEVHCGRKGGWWTKNAK